MSLLVADGLCKQYGAQEVLRRLSLRVEEGDRIGLVGPNGEGKTTLLKLLAGLEEPTSGRVERKRGLRLGYLPQQPPPLEGLSLWEFLRGACGEILRVEDELAALSAELAGRPQPDALRRFSRLQAEFEARGGYAYETRMKAILTGLGFRPPQFGAPVGRLSGGERTRALLARLLLQEPELLMLDEPTNHLDLDAVEWLENWLIETHHSLVIVSHDRYLLDKVAGRIWELADAEVQAYRGNYSAYLRQRAEGDLARRRQYQAQQAFVERTEEFIRRNLAGQRTKEAQGRRTRLERFLAQEAIRPPRVRRKMHIHLEPDARGGERVLQLADLAIGYAPGAPLVQVGDLEVWRRERIAIVGPNGAGKTTLLRTLLGQLPPLAGRCRHGAGIRPGYLAQTQDHLDPQPPVLEVFRSADPGMTEAQARDRLGAFLFSGDDVFKRVGELSGGERSRLELARLAAQNTNLLLLDEPTNHLDIPSQEVLQEALQEFPGTLLLVSHDRYLVQALATRIWIISDGRLVRLEGKWDQYLRWREARAGRVPERAAAGAAADEQRRQARRAERKAQRELERLTERQKELESEITELELRLQDLAAAITQAGKERRTEDVRRLGGDYQAAETRLKALWEEWARLGEALETAAAKLAAIAPPPLR
jgi:ATP-binding cassette subfamily F protein 3